MDQILFEKYKDEINLYFSDDAKKLHKMVDDILYKLGFYNANNDDFYSLSHEIFINTLKDYDKSKSFKGFLYSCLYKNTKIL